MRSSGLTFVFLCLSASVSFAETIEVQGASRISTSLIVQKFSSKSGKLSPDDINKGVKALFETKQFSDVSANHDKNGKLVVVVKEEPVVANVVFNGNKKIKEAELHSIVPIAPGQAWSKETGDEGIKAIIKAYAARGRDQVRVSIRTFQSGNAINVGYQIDEGEKNES